MNFYNMNNFKKSVSKYLSEKLSISNHAYF